MTRRNNVYCFKCKRPMLEQESVEYMVGVPTLSDEKESELMIDVKFELYSRDGAIYVCPMCNNAAMSLSQTKILGEKINQYLELRAQNKEGGRDENV